MIALTALAIAAMAALWYTSVRSLPYYYDAMIFVLAITCAVLLVDTASSSRSKRPRRVVRDGEGRNAPVIYDSHQIVRQIGPWKWDIEEFCTHWFITGETGVGKTSAGLNKLLISLTEHYHPLGRTDTRSQERLLAHRSSHARNGGKSRGSRRIAGPLAEGG